MVFPRRCSGFSDFLRKETAQAVNVKDKRNKLSIQRLLKILTVHFKQSSIPPNGMVCFVGIDSYDSEFIEFIEPQTIVPQFIYDCGPKFADDAIKLAFSTPKSDKYLVVVTGNETRIYSYSDNFKAITTIAGLLIKRQKKGGQSSVRFSRLAEESRRTYATKVVDKINLLCKPPVYICGSKEMRDEIINHSLLLPLVCLSQFDDIGPNFVNLNKKELVDCITSGRPLSDDIKIATIIELIQKNPDLLVFGDEIIPTECEFIATTNPALKTDKHIFIERFSPFYEHIYKFETIGKRYWN